MNTIFDENKLAVYAENIGLSRFENAIFSKLFVAQLMEIDRQGWISSHNVLDEIKVLENFGRSCSTTKKEEAFRHQPLKGLYKKHFFTARFLPKNLQNHLGITAGHNKQIDKIIREVWDKYGSDVLTEEMVYEISHRVTVEAFQERASRNDITGEWIVFYKRESVNYYLSVASHEEEDQLIYDRIRHYCLSEFPFIFTEKGIA